MTRQYWWYVTLDYCSYIVMINSTIFKSHHDSANVKMYVFKQLLISMLLVTGFFPCSSIQDVRTSRLFCLRPSWKIDLSNEWPLEIKY